MRISDWSSDVCSSDLAHAAGHGVGDANHPALGIRRHGGLQPVQPAHHGAVRAGAIAFGIDVGVVNADVGAVGADDVHHRIDLDRSEEHTSELQSLMRISYAVFCLKKKTNNTKNNSHNSVKNTNTT